MIFQSICATLKTANDTEFSLRRGPDGHYTSRGGNATVRYTLLEGGYVLYASAALKKAEDTLTSPQKNPIIEVKNV